MEEELSTPDYRGLKWTTVDILQTSIIRCAQLFFQDKHRAVKLPLRHYFKSFNKASTAAFNCSSVPFAT